MNDRTQRSDSLVGTFAVVAGGLGSLLVIGLLALYLVRSGQPQPVSTARADERKKLWTELQAQNADVLTHYAILKADNGVYRLPVSRALEVYAAESQEGNAASRAKLLKRLENSTKAVTYE
jgi:hypothetical protein